MSFFILSSAQACFSLTQKVLFFFFFENRSFFVPYTQFFPQLLTQKIFLFLLKLSPSFFLFAQNVSFLFFWKFINFWPLYSIFSTIFAPKNLFFSYLAQPQLVFFCPKSPFFLNRSIYGQYSSFFPQFFAQKSFFLFKLNPACFLARNVLFFFKIGQLYFLFFFLNCSIFDPYTQFLPNFWP